MSHEKIKARAKALKKRVKELEEKVEELVEWRAEMMSWAEYATLMGKVPDKTPDLFTGENKPEAPSYSFPVDDDNSNPFKGVDKLEINVGGTGKITHEPTTVTVKELPKEEKNEPDEKSAAKKIPARRKTATRKRVRGKDTKGKEVAETC